MKPIRNILLLMLLSSTTLIGQEVLRSTTGVSGTSSEIETSDGKYIVQQSVGQASVTGTFNQTGITVRQGFIQPPIRLLESSDVNSSEINLVIYPNPFESILTISFNESLEGKVDFVIYDMLGRLVKERQVPAASEITLDLRTLSSAQYVLVISNKERQYIANILKN